MNTALPKIRTLVTNQNTNNPTRKVLIGSRYELMDANTVDRLPGCSPPLENPQPVEDNFGLLHTDLTQKLAWDDLQSQISAYR